jgi:hypothetical protein
MRTRFIDPETLEKPVVPEAYKGTVTDFVLQALLSMHGTQDLDPKKAAEAIVEEVLRPCSEPPLLRLPLGRESHEKMKKMADKLIANAEGTRRLHLGRIFDRLKV